LSSFIVDRTHPPRRIVYRDGHRELVLRPWAFEDIEALTNAISESSNELRAFMPWAHDPLSWTSQYGVIQRFREAYWAGREYVFGLFDGRSHVLLGGAGLHPRTPMNPKALEIGYWCHSAHAGRGWTTLAVRTLAVLAFDWFECDRLQVTHDEENTASRRVVEKCSFVYEGTMRNATAVVPAELHARGYRGTSRHRLYALTPEDYRQLGWVPAVRSSVVLEDAIGGEHSAATRS
jgi:RimJ/RimL family protein N-acetyltransferase